MCISHAMKHVFHDIKQSTQNNIVLCLLLKKERSDIDTLLVEYYKTNPIGLLKL